MSPKQVETPAPLTKPKKPLIIDLEKEWGNFNELISIGEKNIETSRNPVQTTTKMIIEGVVNTPENEHFLVAP